ncbi:signal peptidase I [Homoserinibacter gongjuensis]|uniref:signal peptidase I n=1 Tax=Homoserinibacter gongjuensis TaxID=1162968 RepID=UPI003D6648F7
MPAHRWAGIAQSVLIALAGAAGLLALLAAAAPLVGFQLVRLATGSMSPDLPAGSVLVAQDVDAREIRPGDVVTVMRADGSPVTHRAVEVTPAGAGARLVLKGDANDQVDPAPYVATRVGRVVAGVPFGERYSTCSAAGWRCRCSRASRACSSCGPGGRSPAALLIAPACRWLAPTRGSADETGGVRGTRKRRARGARVVRGRAAGCRRHRRRRGARPAHDRRRAP